MKTLIRLTIATFALPLGTSHGQPAIDFNRQIRPILSNNCFRCHGPDAEDRKGGSKKLGGMRLDTFEGATTDHNGTRGFAPGKPSDSEAWHRMTSTDEDEVMPPPEAGKPLSAEDQALIKAWIEAGAKYEKHWSYTVPQSPAIPKTEASDWAKSPIDHFVYKALAERGLKPAPTADRYTLIRRLALDLTGLPPSIEEVDAFVNSTDPHAYEKLIDRYLADPAYGERWARIWLDLARYADSAGYADDPPRVIWRFRDWVINALNDNKPYDEFTIEQLAGDLLPEPTDEQLVATAFHRNTLTNNEGGTNDEEFRNVAVVDRVNTTMQVWMGTTMACAQCHTHKYDPITHEEYFQFFAFFNNTEDSDKKDERPTLVSFTPELEAKRSQLQAEIASVKKQMADEKAKTAASPTAFDRTGPVAIRYLRVQALQNVWLHLAEVEAFVGEENVALKGTATQSSTAYNGPAKLAIDGNRDGDHSKGSVTHTNQENNPWIEIDLGNAQALDKVTIWNRTDGGTADRLTKFRFIGLDADRKPVWVKSFDGSPKPSASSPVPKTFESFFEPDKAALVAFQDSPDGKTANPLQDKLKKLEKQLAGVKGVTVLIMRELPANKQRETHIQIRGNFMAKGDKVEKGLPAAFHPLPDDAPKNRLSLAKWLVDDKNPLIPRVTANRYWEVLFGTGLVRTSEEFGMQGEMPTHPELLDWLACELRDGGWDTKALIKTIVSSATYQQDSRITPEKEAKDPFNYWLSRGPRFRISAEMIRDQSLAVSGLLSRKMHGPSVKPYRPNLGLRAAFGGSTDWKTSEGEDQYRRGIYTFWQRSMPYPSMAAFDAPSREVCNVRRIRTNTPLQALVSMNDPVYIEAARKLAHRMLNEGGATAAERVSYGFRLCLARAPSDAELSRMLQLVDDARARYTQSPEDAKAFSTGDPNFAAWTLLGNVMLNLGEFFMKC